MVYLVIGFMLGFIVSKYMNNEEFKARIHQSIKDWFKGDKKK